MSHFKLTPIWNHFHFWVSSLAKSVQYKSQPPNNMSATLIYLNMPKRRKQSKQNRKLVQEAMNRNKEMKEFQQVKKPPPTPDVNSFCVVM